MLRQDKETVLELGEAIARIKGKNTIIVSSDLTHYQPHHVASLKDNELIKYIESLDVDQYYRVLRNETISARGYGPIAAIMTECKIMGAKGGRRLKYATSGDTGENKDSVVGYAPILFT